MLICIVHSNIKIVGGVCILDRQAYRQAYCVEDNNKKKVLQKSKKEVNDFLDCQ